MPESINLVPSHEKSQQQKEKLVKVGTVVAVILLFISIIVAGFYLYKINKLKETSKTLDSDIEVLRSDIKELADIEISGRNLYTKFLTLKLVFGNRLYYSFLLEELQKRVPSDVFIESLTASRLGELSISGSASNYLSIAKFINTLTDQKFSLAGKDLEKLFPDVKLNSVNLDVQTDSAKFFIVVSYDGKVLKR